MLKRPTPASTISAQPKPMPTRPEEFEGVAAEVEARFQKLTPDEKRKVLKGITPELGTLFLKIMPEELHPVFVLGMKSNPEDVRDPAKQVVKAVPKERPKLNNPFFNKNT